MQETNYVHGQVFPTELQKHHLEYWKSVPDDYFGIPEVCVVGPPLDIGLKYDEGKPRMDLLDAEFLEDMGMVLKYGAQKYAPHNWRKGLAVSRTIAAIYRHLGAISKGEDIDPESGLRHTAHLGVNCQFLNWMIKNKPEFDDRYKPEKGIDERD
jgi:hypothetical protein